MSSSHSLRSWLRSKSDHPRTRKPRPSSSVRLALECLEDRVTPSVTVTTTSDPTTPIAGQLSLREAINMVNAGQVADNTIILPAGAYQNAQGALNVTHSLILQGAGDVSSIIDGGGKDRVVLIDPTAAVNVQISGVTIRNGSTSGDGGGIDVQDASGQSSVLTVQNCLITANTTSTEDIGGGGIFANNGDINVIDCQVTNNKSAQLGGGIADNNQGTGNVTASNSLIASNTATLGGGGIALANVGAGKLTITGSTIQGNNVTTPQAPFEGGGGIFADTNGAVNISNTTIEGNTSTLDGGGFKEAQHGPTDLVFSNDTINDNQSTQGNGGGIDVSTDSNVTIQNSTLSGNSAALSGGGFADSGNGNVTINNSTLSNNLAKGGSTGSGGGGVDYVGTGAIQIANCIFADNTSNALLTGGFGGGGGLEVDNTAARATIVESIFSDNKSTATGGGGIDVSNGLTLTVTGSTFTGNQSVQGFGGGLFIRTSGTNAAGTASSVVDDTLTGNNAFLEGGGLMDFAPGDLNVTSDTIAGNSSAGGGGVGLAGGTAFFLDTIDAGNHVVANAPGTDILVGNAAHASSLGGNLIGDGTAGGITIFPAGTPNTKGDFVGTIANPLNPLLGLLANNGGPLAGAPGSQQVVSTEALLPGSLAIGNGIVAGAPPTDQRGFNRVINGRTDIGAFQFQNVPLTVTITPATPTVTLYGTATFTFKVNNTGGNPLPADNSTLTITLSSGLSTTGPLTFTLSTIPAGQSQTFTVTAAANALGTQMLTASVASVDANPNTVTDNVPVTVVMPSPHPTPTTNNTATRHAPNGPLSLFAFGLGPTGIDLFEVDSIGYVFAVPFLGGGNPIFLNTALHSPLAVLLDGRLLALLTDSNGQELLIDIINPFNPLIEQAVLAALTQG